jgi:hypothetical protein
MKKTRAVKSRASVPLSNESLLTSNSDETLGNDSL